MKRKIQGITALIVASCLLLSSCANNTAQSTETTTQTSAVTTSVSSETEKTTLAALASEDKASGALIISECTTPNLSIAHSLASNGIYDFDHTFIFDDYTEGELYDILLQCLDKYKTKMSKEAETIVREYLGNLCANRELSFANARTMKNLSRAIFETMILRMSVEADPSDERVVLACDVESFVWKKMSRKIGF